MDPLVFEKTLRRSQDYPGALGAVAFVVLEALRRSGVDPSEAANSHELVDAAFSRLPREDCNTLCDVLFARFHEELRRTKRGEWYEAEGSRTAP